MALTRFKNIYQLVISRQWFQTKNCKLSSCYCVKTVFYLHEPTTSNPVECRVIDVAIIIYDIEYPVFICQHAVVVFIFLCHSHELLQYHSSLLVMILNVNESTIHILCAQHLSAVYPPSFHISVIFTVVDHIARYRITW